MNEAEISRYITETFEGVDVVVDAGNSFFFYNPDRTVPPDHRFPFVTLVTSDLYDQFSNLNAEAQAGGRSSLSQQRTTCFLIEYASLINTSPIEYYAGLPTVPAARLPFLVMLAVAAAGPMRR